MKKLLIVLSSVAITAPTVSAVVSCTNSSNKTPIPEGKVEIGNRWTGLDDLDLETGSKRSKTNKTTSVLTENQGQKSRSKLSSSDKLLRSTLADKNLIEKNLIQNSEDIKFKPYADIGIVEDNVEYGLKWHSKSGASYDKAMEAMGIKNKDDVINYNDLAKINNDSDLINKSKGDGIVLGFMQNASDKGELSPMWDAAPKDFNNNQSEEWFTSRFNKWKKDGLDTKNMTISFGPFANSFWHTAYQNNMSEEELADQLLAISNVYGTRSFDFYFAAPYLSISGSYKESQKLLAGALKVLLERDNDISNPWDFRLSLVSSTESGVGVSPGFLKTGKEEHVGDEFSPLYVFTKYLGMNFKLNLVTGYLTTDRKDPKGDWEADMMKSAIQTTQESWRATNKILNGQDMSEKDVYRRMAVTPWAGRRAENATYDFTPKDAAELRKFAIEKGVGELSMFYITRDHPSFFENNGLSGNALADKNPIDQNLRSGAGFEEYAYAKALNGKMSYETAQSLKEVTDKEKIKQLKGYLDLKTIDDNKAFDDIENDGWDGIGGGGPSTLPWGDGGPTSPIDPGNPPSNKSLYRDRYEANPVRTQNNNWITKKTKKTTSYFSPYLDAGLWDGNNLDEIYNGGNSGKGVKGFNHLTLAFAQQVNKHNDSLEISFAGLEKNNEGYSYWEQNQLKGKVLDPIVKKGHFKNIKVAYGGATTGGMTTKNPWNVAWELSNHNMNKAVEILKAGLIDFQKEIADLVNQPMTKAIDFDIEGHAQENIDELRVLARTLAEMKQSDKKWDFSLTLPVLPSGLTNVGYKVLDVFVEEYHNAGLSYLDIPITNLMLMDYGNPIYQQAIKNGQTNFDLAKQALLATKNNIATSIFNNYGETITIDKVYQLLAATPMIGVNDTVDGVFTLEDAKELYNWANNVGLAYVSMWSMNDDRGRNNNINAVNKSLVTHGLAYLEQYDFARAFAGDWTDKIIKPRDKWENN
ncbi:lipoprotein [Spiroplasma endosymbiont of Panorpa germanica]|uniref:lipoprotein n=1 Tax=Spiroplasma endosymbiont of Panorpa germanica TaxID=3066314 RepID=UPI0030CF6A4B